MRLAKRAVIDHGILRNEFGRPQDPEVLGLGETAVDDIVQAMGGYERSVHAALFHGKRRLIMSARIDDLGKILLQLRLTSEEARRSIELTDFAINLEHAGDVVAKNLLVLAQERLDKNWRFSPQGWSELTELHGRLVENMHLALNVLVSQDLPSARQLVVEKEKMRELERRSHDGHLRRLQSGMPESIETSGMHLEIARGLKEINSLLVPVAYPILKQSGDLLESRLAKSARV